MKNLKYDRKTGLLYKYKKSKGCYEIVGEVTPPNRYGRVQVGGERKITHKIVWFLNYGEWPADEIDHIDGDTSNNKIENLRLVNRSGNMRNTAMRKDNKSGVVGVYQDSGYWVAAINIDGVQTIIAKGKDFDEVVTARKNAERNLGYHQNHGRSKCTAG